MLTDLQGQIEIITYTNGENLGFEKERYESAKRSEPSEKLAIQTKASGDSHYFGHSDNSDGLEAA